MQPGSQAYWRTTLDYLLVFWTGLIAVVWVFHDRISLPVWLQVAGRTHPLLLHFPIVLILFSCLLFFVRNPFKNLTLSFLWLITAHFTAITVLTGLLLKRQEYEGEALTYHQWLGTATYLLSLLLYYAAGLPLRFKQGLAVLALAGLVGTGHFGAEVTHGEDFIAGPFLSASTASADRSGNLVYHELIQPIFDKKCVSCHREGKTKGELRLDSWEGFMKGGKSGPLLAVGDTSESLIAARIHLPMSEKKHMPPKNKPQLTAEELEILDLWVASADIHDRTLAELDPEHPLWQWLEKGATASKYTFPAAREKDIEALNTSFRRVAPLYPDAPALEATYYVRSAFDPRSLTDLKGVAPQLVRIQLNGMPLEGVDLSLLQGFPNLEEIRLNFTNLQADQLKALAPLPKLSKLTLSGNAFDREVIGELARFAHLKELYFWQPNWNSAWKEELKSRLPDTRIDFGFDASQVTYALNAPEISTEKLIFSDSVQVTLEHPVQGTEIRYRLDGLEPDSTTGTRYQGPFWVHATSHLKAKGFAAGWYGSASAESILFKSSYRPKTCKLVHEPNKHYAAQGAQTLMDGVKAKLNHTSGEWLGFTDEPFELELGLDEGPGPREIGLSLLYHEGAYIFPPEQLEIWIGAANTWKKIPAPKVPVSHEIGEIRYGVLTCPLPGEAFDQIRVRLKPIGKLPGWHPGAGAKGWVFIDEILLN